MLAVDAVDDELPIANEDVPLKKASPWWPLANGITNDTNDTNDTSDTSRCHDDDAAALRPTSILKFLKINKKKLILN